MLGEVSWPYANLRGAIVTGCDINEGRKKNTIMPEGKVVSDPSYKP
ncbi:MAG: hypothetical protein AB4080_01565 [Trichodesmium sp.]